MSELSLVILTAALAAVAVGLGAYVVHHHRRWLARAVRERVIVHTDAGDTFDGLLVANAADGIYLSPATVVAGTTRHDLDGGAFVPRDRVAWMQRPDGGRE